MALRCLLGMPCIKTINKGKTMTERIKLEKIRLDGGTQPRKEIDEPLVQHYTEILLEGKDKFPPIDLWFDGKAYWPSDGFHRYHAHKRAGYKDIEAKVNKGTKRDAFLACLPANGKHGKQRTPRHFLGDPQHPHMAPHRGATGSARRLRRPAPRHGDRPPASSGCCCRPSPSWASSGS